MLRRTCPLIHNITNYVTVNDCANMVLACGASPIMADDAAEVEDITTICGGLNINIGTLNSRTITSMLLAGKKANQLGHPVVLDPVGAGASRLRTDTAYRLLRDVKFTVIRGNISPNMSESYDFKLYTPWKFGLSLGHTIGNYLAIGAGYEYADYSAMDTRVIDGGYYDTWYGDYYDSSSSDKAMNRHTEQTLKGVSTVKLGLEFKPDPTIAVRFGYNYVSPMYKKDGFKNGTISQWDIPSEPHIHPDLKPILTSNPS